jgi:hypothetical protein
MRPSNRFAALTTTLAILTGATLLLPAACGGTPREASADAAPEGMTMPNSAQDASSSFPFVIPWDDAAKTATDVSALNAPLNEKSRLVIKDGHFYDGNGKRVRFVGTNFGAGACFPEKADAPKIAARLRKFGINLVRLHHMDATWAQPNLFYVTGGTNGRSTRKLDPQSLDRLDFFVAELKKNGIYVDLNLHVSREWLPADGFPEGDKLPALGKVAAYFESRAIELQKEFATQMLTRKNPYTGLAWKDDPVIAVIELNNEDSLVGHGGDGLPPRYRDMIVKGWNDYLKAKYKTTAALKTAWNSNAKPLGENLLKNGRMQSGTTGWVAETQAQTTMKLLVEDAAGQTNAPEGKVLHITDLKLDATNWHLQLHQTGLDLKAGEMYTVSFAARSEKPRAVPIGTRLDQAPWSFTGLDTTIGLDTRWKRYTFSFIANNNVVPSHSRLSFMLGDSAEDVYLADVSLRPGGGGVDIAAGQSVEAGNLDIPGVSATPPGTDYVQYLMNVEDKYAQGLRTHIRSLGCKTPVTCSQASYGGVAGVWRESRLDWVDMHSYWQHPSFPGRAFDPNNYRIQNTSLVKSDGAGTLDGLAMHRVAGKPFTVSEYDHPAPNEYAAEMTPIIFAYAAYQDWDGVFLFAYEPTKGDKITGYFDQAMHPAKLAFMPWAANVFRRGDLIRTSHTMALTLPSSQVAALKGQGTDYSFWPDTKANDFLTYRAALSFSPSAPKAAAKKEPLSKHPPAFRWNHDSDLITVDSSNSQAIIGFIGGKKAATTEMSVDIAPSARNFAAIALTTKDGKRTRYSSSLLLTAVDKVENPGLKWNADRTFAEDSWKSGPTHAEVPSGTITIQTYAKSATVYALDATGKRMGKIDSTLVTSGPNPNLSFRIGPEHKTLWFEVEATH